MGTVCSKSGHAKLHKKSETAGKVDGNVVLTYEVTDNIVRSAPHVPCDIPEGSLGLFLWEALSRRGDRTCIVCMDSSWSYTHREIRNYAKRVGSSLIKNGIRIGDNVCIYSPNQPQALIVILAVIFIGGTITLCHPAESSEELRRRLEANKTKILVTGTECASKAKEAASKLPLLQHIFAFGHFEDFTPFSHLAVDDGNMFTMLQTGNSKEQEAIIMYTDGVTGPPKPVILSHYNIKSSLVLLGQNKESCFEKNDVVLAATSFSDSFGLIFTIFNSLVVGCKLVTISNLVSRQLIEAIRVHKVTAIPLNPAILTCMLNADIDQTDVTSVTKVMGKGCPRDLEQVKLLMKLLPSGISIQQVYSSTEISAAGLINSNDDDMSSIGSCICFTECKTVDFISGKALGPSVPGELLIRGPQVMKGYLNDSKTTMEVFDDDGWYHTGDIVSRTEVGQFYYVDRKSEMILYKSNQISPAEVEGALLSHPAVQDVVVIGMSDKNGEEVPVPHVKLDPNKQQISSSVSAELLSYLSNKTKNRIKLSNIVFLTDNIPKTRCGYINRYLCRQRWSSPRTPKVTKNGELKQHHTLVSEETIVSPSKTTEKMAENETIIRNRILMNTASLDKIPEVSFCEFVFQYLAKYSSKTCIVNADTKEKFTYDDVIYRSKCVGSALLRRGFHPRDVFCIYSPNQADFLIAILGVTAIGGIVTLCNPTYTLEELKHQLVHSKASYLLTNKGSAVKASNAVKDNPKIKETFVLGEHEGLVSFKTLVNDDGSKFRMFKDLDPRKDVLFLPYSSGTTGLPKGVMLTHYSVIANLVQLHCNKTLYVSEEDTVLGLLPFFHIYGLVVVLFHHIIRGAPVIAIPKFNPDVFFDSIESYRVTNLPLVPFLVVFMTQSPLLEKHDMTEVKKIICGSAPLSDKQTNALRAKLPQVTIHQGYGMTELSPVASYDKWALDPASVGKPLPGTEVKVVNIETNEPLDVGEDGEICIKGPQVMKGYLENEQATADTISAEGWVHTGDIGHYTKEGLFYVVDRKKELIKYRGLQVSPSEIESIILSHPAIRDVGVVGLPDEESGELPLAFVVLKPGFETVDPEEISKHVASKAAPYKRLRGGVRVVNEIPRNASGKILRRKLKELLQDMLKPTIDNLRSHEHETSKKYDIKIKDHILMNEWDTTNIPIMSFGHYLHDCLIKYGSKACIVNAENGNSKSFKDVVMQSKNVGSGLLRRGFRPGDTLMLYSTNQPDFLVAILAVSMIGGKITLSNPAYSKDETLHQLNHSGAKYLLCSSACASKIEEALGESSSVQEVFIFGSHDNFTPFADLLADSGSRFEMCKSINPKKDVLFLPYSSGTTGLPKGVMLSHYNIIANLEQLSAKGTFPLCKDDISLALLPFFHIYGLVAILLHTITHGGTVVCIQKFAPDLFLKSIEKYKITYLPLVPFLIVFMTQTPLFEKYDLKSINRIVSAAAPLSDKQANALKLKMPNVILNQGYGMTELSPAAMFDTFGLDAASTGPPLPGVEVKIIDIYSEECVGEGMTGELCIKGPNIMLGYLNNDEATRSTIDDKGWLHTGDIAYYTNEGLIYIVDRKKELIKYRGMQVSPSELESVILKHSDVKDVGVIGLPDEASGELPLAYVVLHKADSLTADELNAFVNEKVTHYKRLRGGIRFIDAIPRNASGKILRRQLKVMMMESLSLPKEENNDPSGTRQSEPAYGVSISENIISNPLPSNVLPEMTFGEFLLKNLQNHGTKTCIVSAESGESLTYDEVISKAKKIASGLKRHGLSSKDTIFLICPNCPQFLISLIGITFVGARVTLCNPVYTAAEIKHQIHHSGSSFVICHQVSASNVSKATEECDIKEIFVIGDHSNMKSFEVLTNDDGELFRLSSTTVKPDDVALLPYSSGTTGLPKGVMLTHRNIIANIMQLSYKDTMPVPEDDVCLALLPFFHIYGLVVLLMLRIIKGGTVVSIAKFNPELFVSSIEKYNVTTLPLVPFLVVFLSTTPLRDKFNMSSLRRIICGAAPLSDKQAVALKSCLPQIILSQGFGMTELSPVATYDTVGLDVASVGAPIPGTDCKIIDTDSGEILPAEKSGELLIKGPQIMKGYLNNEIATKETVDEDGWLHTGDVAYWTTKGLIYIVDRKKELIKFRGMQVSPSEIESILLKHSDVKDAGVVGLPDDESGELPLGFVVRKENHSDVSEKDILDFVNNQIAPYKRLRGGVKFVKQIPRSAAGKILRIRLKMMMVSMIESLEIKITGRQPKSTIEISQNVVTDVTNFCTPNVSFGEFMLTHMEKLENSTCMIDSISGESYSFSRVLASGKSVASALKKKGIKSDDVICIYSTNCLAFTSAFVGSILTGVSVCFCSPQDPLEKVEQKLIDLGVKYIFASEDCAEKGEKIVSNESSKELFVFGRSSFTDLIEEDSSDFTLPDNLIPDKDTIFIMDSQNGKYVKWSHANVISNIIQMIVKKKIQINSGDLCLTPHQMGDAIGLFTLIIVITNGGTVILPKMFGDADIADSISMHKVKTLILSQNQSMSLMNDKWLTKMSSVETFVVISDGCTDEKLTKMDKFPNKNLVHGLHIPESTFISLLSANIGDEVVLGKPLPGARYKVVSDNGDTLDAEKPGELLIEGPQVIADASRGSWLKTGLICKWTADGNFYLVENKRLSPEGGGDVARIDC